MLKKKNHPKNCKYFIGIKIYIVASVKSVALNTSEINAI